MINTIRADIYRLFRSKGFWITQAVMAAITIFTILLQATGHVGIAISTSNTPTQESSIKATGTARKHCLISRPWLPFSSIF